MKNIQDFDSVMIKLASPEQIRAWSCGEVKKPETINYRTLRPEKDGLFCERIFGTTKEWECYCGKFKSIRYKGVICDRCGVEVAHFSVRRERMGHIELAAPVSHIWYYRSIPSIMGLLLDLSVSALRSILYYELYVVIEPGDTELARLQLLTEDEYADAQERYGSSFTAGIGAEAICTLLEMLDLDALATELRSVMVVKGSRTDKRLLRRIEVVENFRRSGNLCEWMILDVIPVIPPELRPMVQLDGGRFATSDLNDLYRRVINRNNRLKRLISLNAPDIIVRNEKRMLQEAVDALFDNSKKKRAVKGASTRPLRSLSDLLKGKQGRFRQNLLGKRVDYSGRSVISVGPQLKLHQCGLPVMMALELYKPFVMRRLVEREAVFNIRRAKALIEQGAPEVWSVLGEVVKEHPVLLNRAPTLHRLGVQAFEPVLTSSKAIRLHPLVCHAFNADFDGDQMAIHVPITLAARLESWTLMLSSTNLMNPANGQPIVLPSQDMVLGLYLLTVVRPGAKGEGLWFGSPEEVLLAREAGRVAYQASCRVRLEPRGRFVETTPGRVLFNQALPNGIEWVNHALGDKEIRELISKTYEKHGPYITVQMLDAIKDAGFQYATLLGATIGLDDILVPEEKPALIDASNKEVEKIQQQYLGGHITQEERYNKVIEVWSKTNEDLADLMMHKLEKDKGGFNSIHLMVHSKARGARNQIRQLAGMRGLMAKPSGDIIELPIRSNFKEGLSVIEYFISTNGARKGLADTALKTADAGYLTRRLVDIAQDVVVSEEDCGAINGIDISTLKEGDEIVESLADRIRGCYTLERVKHPITGEILIDVDREVSDETAELLEEVGVESVRVRTVLTCEAQYGVCSRCYGRDLATGRPVNIGEAVGIIAAQSIGQPGTQLTMRTFHIGGAASMASEDNWLSRPYPVLVRGVQGPRVPTGDGEVLFTRRGKIFVAKVIDQVAVSPKDKLKVKDGQQVVKGEKIIEREKDHYVASEVAFISLDEEKKRLLLVAQDQEILIRNGSALLVQEGDILEANKPIVRFDPFMDPIIAEQDGRVHFQEMIQGTTLNEEINIETGNVEKKIADVFFESLQPRIVMKDKKGEDLASYYLPGGAYLNVEDGQMIKAGTILAKLLKESTKTQDITGGLPRVGELFEARRPREAAVLAFVGGTVHFKGIVKDKRVILIEDPFGETHRHYVPMGRHLLVREGDVVEAGDLLTDGPYDLHEILRISGENRLQQFLMDQVQEVYRMQGVNINDKHIGIIIRQMMRKVEIVSVGDTKFVYGQQVDKYRLKRENEVAVKEGGHPAVGKPLLLGITRASLNIDSWISAASFQETTRVLTNAAIAGEVDPLRGLKENVVIGRIIPAGTGTTYYQKSRETTADAALLEQVGEVREES